MHVELSEQDLTSVLDQVAFKSLLLNIRGKIDDMIYKDEE